MKEVRFAFASALRTERDDLRVSRCAILFRSAHSQTNCWSSRPRLRLLLLSPSPLPLTSVLSASSPSLAETVCVSLVCEHGQTLRVVCSRPFHFYTNSIYDTSRALYVRYRSSSSTRKKFALRLTSSRRRIHRRIQAKTSKEWTAILRSLVTRKDTSPTARRITLAHATAPPHSPSNFVPLHEASWSRRSLDDPVCNNKSDKC